MKIKSLDHIGIAVKSIHSSLKTYHAIGLKSVGVEEVAEQKVRVAFLPVGEVEIELLESTTPDGPVAKYIEKNGEGLQHIALRVDNLEAALADLKAKGVELIDEKPRYGAGGAMIAFVHPRSMGGVLLELSERD